MPSTNAEVPASNLRVARYPAIEGNFMRLILIVLLVILLLGALPVWPYSANWGYYPGSGLGLLLIILLVLAVTRRA
jgi:hypothetical protein